MIYRDALDFKTTLEDTCALFLGSRGATPNKNSLHHANEMQIDAVRGALTDGFSRLAGASYELTNRQARSFLRHGAGRRWRMNMLAFESILAVAPFDREQPLDPTESNDVTRDLNLIYVNVRGILDNFAWCSVHELANDIVPTLRPMSINLFSGRMWKDPRMTDLAKQLEAFKDWSSELKKLRDPVAHRIPLYLPTLMDEAQSREFVGAMGAYWDKVGVQDFEQAESSMDKANSLGRFGALIVHDPDEAPTPMYPTLPQDLGIVSKVGNVVVDHLTHGTTASPDTNTV